MGKICLMNSYASSQYYAKVAARDLQLVSLVSWRQSSGVGQPFFRWSNHPPFEIATISWPCRMGSLDRDHAFQPNNGSGNWPR